MATHHELQTDDFAASFVGVWRRVTTEPRSFFQEMPVTGGLQNPLVFLVACLAVSGVGFLLVGPRPRAVWFVLEGVVRSFVYAAILMVIARQLFGGGGDYEASYRVVAYASAPIALFWVPVVGRLTILYIAFLIIVGLERAHGLDATRSALTLLLAGIAIVVLGHVLGFGPACMAGPPR
jgi:hypothetical protein